MGSDRVHRKAFISFPCFIFKLGIEHMGNHYIIPYTFFVFLAEICCKDFKSKSSATCGKSRSY